MIVTCFVLFSNLLSAFQISKRLNRQHNVLHGVVGSNYVGPVQEVLEHVPNRTKYVVDLGTGTGKWLAIPVLRASFMILITI